MPELVVLGFKDVTAADKVVDDELKSLQAEGLLKLSDWARVIRRQDGRIDTRQGTNTTGSGAAGGALWGMLFGLIFLIPVAGLVIGGVAGALMGKLADYGIDDKFIKDLGAQITPGSSALFLYVEQSTPDRVIERLAKYQPSLLRTSLTQAQEDQLRGLMQAAGESAESQAASS
jgi:uncharacterized membrane protein